MQLRVARLCLDCEEVHEARECPKCASEAFAYLSRWVPAPERRTTPRPAQPAKPPAVTRTKQALIGAGIIGAVAYGLTRWSRAVRSRLDEAAARLPSGELK